MDVSEAMKKKMKKKEDFTCFSQSTRLITDIVCSSEAKLEDACKYRRDCFRMITLIQ